MSTKTSTSLALSVALASCSLFCASAHGATLVAKYTFENTFADQAGSNNGTGQNGATFAPSLAGHGQALSLDGVDDYVSTTDLDLTTVSIAAWVNADANAKGFVVNKNYDGISVPYSLNVGGNNGPEALNGMAFFNGGWRNSQTPTNGTDFVDVRGTGWRHVVGTFDGTTLSYYVDGVLKQSSIEANVATLPANNNLLDIGRYANDEAYFKGLIDDLQIYSGALTPTEVATLVPEPSSCAVFGLGVSLVQLRRRRPR